MNSFEPTKPVDATAHVAAPPIASQHGTVTLGTLVSYLLGSREAILTLASHRDTAGLGLIFVMSAAFAREYDGEDLLYEPWHLLVPLVASLATAFVLFVLVSKVAVKHGAGFRPFLVPLQDVSRPLLDDSSAGLAVRRSGRAIPVTGR